MAEAQAVMTRILDAATEEFGREGFGGAKAVGRMRQVMVRGLDKVDQMFVLTMSAYNLTRLRTLGSVRLQTGT